MTVKAADKERRGDINFLRGSRALRDARRNRHIEDTLAALDKAARICAQASARKRGLNVGYADDATRRRERRQLTAKSIAEYREALAPLLGWFARMEAVRDPSDAPIVKYLEKQK